ncbi:MAG: hypothetical protein GC129_03445 [Proteobacteria bacterium]|nr:hypothetical protein [Pseudomonadota bacterium]
MPNRIPPYFHNFDDTHCLQCSLRSALEYFNPKKKWTWAALDKLSGKTPHGTWHMTFLAALSKKGYETVCIENFEPHKFIANPKSYLKVGSTPESYEYLLRTTNIPQEVQASQALLKAEKEGRAELHYRNSTAKDIKDYLKKGYLIIHWVNGRALNRREGYGGHFILVYDMFDAKTVTAHDNGGLYQGQPTGKAEFKIDINFLVKCATSGKKTGGFYAIRPKTHA